MERHMPFRRNPSAFEKGLALIRHLSAGDVVLYSYIDRGERALKAVLAMPLISLVIEHHVTTRLPRSASI